MERIVKASYSVDTGKFGGTHTQAGSAVLLIYFVALRWLVSIESDVWEI